MIQRWIFKVNAWIKQNALQAKARNANGNAKICQDRTNAYVQKGELVTLIWPPVWNFLTISIYRYEKVGFNCIDINECDRKMTVCSDNETCVNTQGGYECVQPPKCPVRVDGSSIYRKVMKTDEFGYRQVGNISQADLVSVIAVPLTARRQQQHSLQKQLNLGNCHKPSTAESLCSVERGSFWFLKNMWDTNFKFAIARHAWASIILGWIGWSFLPTPNSNGTTLHL